MSQTQENLDTSTNKLTETSIYHIKDGVITIAGEQLKPEISKLLKEQAHYIETSQFYEILNAAVINESARLAFEAPTLEALQFAKALNYYGTMMRSLIKDLKK